MNHGRIQCALLLAVMPLTGCTPGWYQRSADREVARIVEARKEQTLGYKPQSEAAAKTPEKPAKKAYEKIPQTRTPESSIAPLEPLKTPWPDLPLGPKLPGPEDDNYDFVPESYASYGAATERQGPKAPGQLGLELDLIRSIGYAVANAREYQDRMEDLYLATLDVTLQRHLFEPRPFANTSVNYAGDQGGRTRTPAGQKRDYLSALSVVNRAGVRQQLPYGGEVVAEQLVEVVHALNDNTAEGETAETAISASIPLLKGAGLVNLEPLISSERQLVYAVRSFETYRRAFVVNIASQYFRLVTQQQGINNRRQNYENLKLLSERSLALYAAGKNVSFLDVQRARQNLLNAENSLIDSINQYEAALDTYKIAIGMPVAAELTIVPVELEVNIPDLENVSAQELALKYRLDLQTARDRVEDARRGVSNAKNGLLPDVTLTGRTGVGNFDGDDWPDYNRDTMNYSAGVFIDWPIDQLSERNDFRRSLIQLERAQRSYVTAREQVIADVRQVARNIRLAIVTLEIQKRSVELNQKRLDLAGERMMQGKAQVLDFVDAQSALLNAQDAYDRARANLQTQVLAYLRDTGTLRLDPNQGELARAMDRAGGAYSGEMFEEIEARINDLEKK